MARQDVRRTGWRVAGKVGPGRPWARMDLSQLPLFRLISRRMDFLNARQEVLARNIANSDTPGYAPKDLQVKNFSQLVQMEQPLLKAVRTDPRHLSLSREVGRYEQRQVAAQSATLSGNGVELQKELMKVSETSMDYQLATNVYKKQVGLFRMVLSRPPGT
jgi:flagellar basal-body rod protein FlgB